MPGKSLLLLFPSSRPSVYSGLFRSFPACGERTGFFSKRIVRCFLLLLFFLAVFVAAPSEAGAASTVRKDAFIEQLFEARGFRLPSGEKSALNAALEYNLVPVPAGKLSDPLTRMEAIRFAVHSLGLFFESGILADLPLPYKDVSSLSREDRGVLAAALSMDPPLLKKGVTAFGPSQRISPAEAKNIVAIVKAATRSLRLSVKMTPLKGMTVQIHREGTYSVLPKWRALVNGYETREDADLFRMEIAGYGIEATVDSYNYDWRVRSSLFDRYSGIREFLEASRSLGREGVVFSTIPNWEMADAPRFWTMITFDPSLFALRPVFPSDGMTALAPLSTMLGNGAAAVMNGGYFATAARRKGGPIGAVMVDGMLLNTPFTGRTCFGWNDNNRAAFGHLTWRGRVHLPGGFMDITGINRTVKGDGVILFSSHFGEFTPLPDSRVVEVVLDGNRIEEVRFGGGNPIPEGKRVLAVYGAASRFLEQLRPGDRIDVAQELNEGDPTWNSMTYLVQGGPFLLRNGEIVLESENLSDSIINRRHPRSVIGLTKQGHWFFFVGDGRNAVHSLGFTLEETAGILKSAGATYALNLDGGGSSGMLSGRGFWNVPSDGTERPVSYGIAAFPRGGR